MDKFLTKKRALESNDDDSESNVAGHSSGAKAVVRQYKEDYLSFGFISSGEEQPRPECLVCGEKLANQAMVPSKLKRHLHTKHSHLCKKPIEYFNRLLAEQKRQAKQWAKITTVSDKAQEASYAVAEIVAKKMKSHTIAESVILPACCKIVNIMFGEKYEQEILKIPLSDNTISRRILDMSEDVESQVITKIKEANVFAFQLDESTDITGKAQLLAFSRFVCNEEFIEQFLFCKILPETTKGQDIFDVVNTYFTSHNLSWELCISICTDGAPSMSGRVKGFVALAKQKNPAIVFTHCFLHREALISKSVVPELQKVLDETIKMVNYIKSRPLKSRLFSVLCSAMDAAHTQLLLHTDVRWLSRGRVLSRFYELREELIIFFTSENSEMADRLSDETWCNKVAFLADICQALNTLNKSMQGKNENILTCTDKITTFKEKLTLWGARIKKDNKVEMFELTKSCRLDKNLVNLILQSLLLLSNNIDKYFPSLDISSLDWVRDPFVPSAYASAALSVAEEDELAEIRNDRGQKLKHSSTDMASFWLSLRQEFPMVTKKVIEALLPFSTSYLCEAAFSAMNTMKCKNRSRLQSLEEDLRVCLSTIRPRTRDIMRHHQAQVSH
ncbi:zinc finger BED domain-containing protein 5-like [Pseudophryne corroboree]|uniref:zinc finger BED domain-containing protein 5-like n=1 Tax=Pseudophryne corroboree TaxID=495146 RepID=UPI003081ECF7